MGLYPRTLPSKILCLGTTFFILCSFFLSLPHSAFFSSISLRQPSALDYDRLPGRCPPKAYANGRWSGPDYRVNSSTMTEPSEALAFSGFSGCASSREFDWHLASDNAGQYARFPNAQSYTWSVGKEDGCEGLEKMDKEMMVRDMVQQGGWLLVGDSITEGHFFSLSCILHPHVIATPTYKPNSYFDRAWPQNLYLNPSSHLAKDLYFPKGFNISSTPLVTFRRIDLLYTQEELVHLHESLHPHTVENFKLFSDEDAWSLSPKEYANLFLEGGYSTMVVSTAGHWTTTLFGGYAPDAPPAFRGADTGIDGVLEFFRAAMTRWTEEVQGFLDDAKKRESIGLRRQWRRRQVLVRAYLPGHDNCHSRTDPWEEVDEPRYASYNWGSIWRYNEIFENILTDKEKYPDIHYLAIERPGRLRPDAHTTGDCLHIMAGGGVMEGWSHYIWHFVNKELGRGYRSRLLGR